jgi:uncharacterized membrane protein YhaH (DUF805 family)
MWELIKPLLRRYLWIEGRSSRREWWQIEIIAIASYWFVGNGAAVVSMLHDQPPLLPMPVRLLLGALMFWINIASTVRRLHDRNKSGRWAMLYLFPVFGIIWHFIECGLLPSRNHGNRYGPPERPSQSPFERLSMSLQELLTPAAPQPTMRPAAQQPAKTTAPAHRASARNTRAPRLIGPATVSAVNRTRSPNKLILAIAAAAVAIALLATALLPPLLTAVGIMQDAPVFRR